MVKSTYTKTALASLITLYSLNGLATVGEVKEHRTSSEVMETSNKKLKNKMDRICNADPEKKAKEAKRKAEEEAMRANEAKKKAEEQAMKKAHDEKKKAEKEAMKAHEAKKKAEEEAKRKADEAKKKEKSDDNKHKTKDIKSIINKNIENKITIINSNDADVCCTQRTGLKITFGGVVDAQRYSKTSPNDLKQYNTMPGKSKDYYTVTANQITGNNPLFTEGIGNIGDYSENMGVSADAMLHLRAENKNEDLGILYGADLQFDVPVTQGKVSSKNRGAHIFVNTEYGDMRLGYQFGPEAMMRLDATKIATVDGAADSGWFKKVNLEGSTASFPFYLTPRLYTESFSSESEKLSFRMAGKYNKAIINTLPFRVAYYSPSYMGARFGVSYSPRYERGLFSVSEMNAVSGIPNDYNNEKETLRHIGPDYERIISAGVSYEYDFEEYKLKVKASAVGEYGLAKKTDNDKHQYSEYVEYNDLMGANFGVSADYKIDEDQTAKFAASFAHLDKSGQPQAIHILNGNKYEKLTGEGEEKARVDGLKQFQNNTMYWTVGAGYQYGNIYSSLTYFGSQMNDEDRLHDVALGVQYNLSAPGSKSKFVPYAALHYFTTNKQQTDAHKVTLKGSSTVASNKGFLLLTGVKFSF